jgi:trk system potassium uptake protein TrkH
MQRVLSSSKMLLFSFFIVVILLGSLLLYLPDMWRGAQPLHYVDALFTSVSAVCVTGLVTVNTSQFTRLGQIVIMLLIQVGGLGIVTFSTIYLTGPNARISFSSRKIINEYYIESIEYNPRRIMRNIVLLTLVTEAIGTAVLMQGFRASDPHDLFFASLFHAISAFCNAGFSLYDNSLMAYNGNAVVLCAVMGLIIFGGLGFVVIQDLLRKFTQRGHRLSLHSRITLIGASILIVAGAAIFYLFEQTATLRSLPPGDRWLAAFFQSVTTRTAGFNTVNEAGMAMPSKVLSMLLMFIGGGPGSTAGGVKITTFFLMLAVALRSGDEQRPIRLGHRTIPPLLTGRAMAFVIKAVLLLGTAIGLLTLTETVIGSHHDDFLEIIFETFSAFGTVGLSLGLTQTLTVLGKIVIILTMFAGRVGLVSLAMPATNLYRERFVEYPEGDVLIG